MIIITKDSTPADIIAMVSRDQCIAESVSIHPLRTIALYCLGKAQAADDLFPSITTMAAVNEIRFHIDYSTRHKLYR
jgi:hypothetical protein